MEALLFSHCLSSLFCPKLNNLGLFECRQSGWKTTKPVNEMMSKPFRPVHRTICITRTFHISVWFFRAHGMVECCPCFYNFARISLSCTWMNTCISMPSGKIRTEGLQNDSLEQHGVTEHHWPAFLHGLRISHERPVVWAQNSIEQLGDVYNSKKWGIND